AAHQSRRGNGGSDGRLARLPGERGGDLSRERHDPPVHRHSEGLEWHRPGVGLTKASSCLCHPPRRGPLCHVYLEKEMLNSIRDITPVAPLAPMGGTASAGTVNDFKEILRNAI